MDFLNNLKSNLETKYPTWNFEVGKYLKENEFGLFMKQENPNFHLVFRLNKYNESAINLINILSVLEHDVNNPTIVIENLIFKKSHRLPNSIYNILESNITPVKLIDNEKKVRLETYSEKIGNLLTHVY